MQQRTKCYLKWNNSGWSQIIVKKRAAHDFSTRSETLRNAVCWQLWTTRHGHGALILRSVVCWQLWTTRHCHGALILRNAVCWQLWTTRHGHGALILRNVVSWQLWTTRHGHGALILRNVVSWQLCTTRHGHGALIPDQLKNTQHLQTDVISIRSFSAVRYDWWRRCCVKRRAAGQLFVAFQLISTADNSVQQFVILSVLLRNW